MQAPGRKPGDMPLKKPRAEARAHRDVGRAGLTYLDGTWRNAESPSFRRGLLEQARNCRAEQDLDSFVLNAPLRGEAVYLVNGAGVSFA